LKKKNDNSELECRFQMMKHAWDSYKKYAWGANELRPISKRGHSASIFGQSSLGATIVDALDTLYLMEMHDEFKDGRDWVATSFKFEGVRHISIFIIIYFIIPMFCVHHVKRNQLILFQQTCMLCLIHLHIKQLFLPLVAFKYQSDMFIANRYCLLVFQELTNVEKSIVTCQSSDALKLLYL